MSDVKVELKEMVTRDDAATLLSTLSNALGSDGLVELPLGPSMVTVQVPDLIRAEIEVEVEGDEVEVELEFKWSTAQPVDDSAAQLPAPPRARAPQSNGRRSARGSRRLRPVLRNRS